jgi:hypothetical protein
MEVMLLSVYRVHIAEDRYASCLETPYPGPVVRIGPVSWTVARVDDCDDGEGRIRGLYREEAVRVDPGYAYNGTIRPIEPVAAWIGWMKEENKIRESREQLRPPAGIFWTHLPATVYLIPDQRTIL